MPCQCPLLSRLSLVDHESALQQPCQCHVNVPYCHVCLWLTTRALCHLLEGHLAPCINVTPITKSVAFNQLLCQWGELRLIAFLDWELQFALQLLGQQVSRRLSSQIFKEDT